jgi:transposase
MSNKPRRQWTAQEKADIVLAALSGKASVAELCNANQISQPLFYQWKEAFLKGAKANLERGGIDSQVTRLEARCEKMTKTIGELTLELKKNDW